MQMLSRDISDHPTSNGHSDEEWSFLSSESRPWDLKTQFLREVAERGGFVNCHAHLDKAFYITREGLSESMVDMETKWWMSDDIKQASSVEDIANRVRQGIDLLLHYGVTETSTFVDAYSAVGTKAIDAMRQVQKEYEARIRIVTMSQPIGGLLDEKERHIYERVTNDCTLAGGLPSKDRPYDGKSFDYLFSIARNLNKPLHIHIDQENNPHERDTEKVIYYTKKYGYEGRVVLIHAVSLAAQPKKYRDHIYQELADLGIAVVVCPSAALSMKQIDHEAAPTHNSIANVPEMLNAGITVGIGVDNMGDFYQPFVDGDMWVEVRMLMEACRFYDFDRLLDVCTTNGRKILSTT